MRVALVYHQFIRKGGLEGYLLGLLKALVAAGHEVELVTCRVDEVYRALASKVHMIDPGWNHGVTLARFASASAEVVKGLSTEAVWGFGRSWRQDIHRAGGGCHAVYAQMLPWWKRWRTKNRRELAIEKRLYTGGETRGFVVNSEKVAGELRGVYGVKGGDIRVIRTAVDTAFYTPAGDREALRRARGVREDDKVLLFVSLDHVRKGLPMLLKALELRGVRKDWHLWVAGATAGPWMAELARVARVTDLGLQGDLRPLYQAADLLVHPTRYDACANTVLQAMACGLPGLVSTGDGAAELVVDGVNGWRVDPNNAEALVARMTEGLEGAAGLREAAREAVLPLTWDAHLGEWMEFWAERGARMERSAEEL